MPTVTWNPSDKSYRITLSGGNLTTISNTNWGSVRATASKTSGKFYWEILVNAESDGGNDIGIGTSSANLETYIEISTTYSAGNGALDHVYNTGDLIGVVWDLANKTLDFYQNNVFLVRRTYTFSGSIFAMVSVYNSSNSMTTNFGATAFVYAIPAGCTSYDESQGLILKYLILDGTNLRSITAGNLVTRASTGDSGATQETAFLTYGMADLTTWTNSLLSQVVTPPAKVALYKKS
jgi:hypothetical protein